MERARRVSGQRVGKQFDFGIAAPRGVTLSPLSRRLTILQLQHGIDSEHKWSRI